VPRLYHRLNNTVFSIWPFDGKGQLRHFIADMSGMCFPDTNPSIMAEQGYTRIHPAKMSPKTHKKNR